MIAGALVCVCAVLCVHRVSSLPVAEALGLQQLLAVLQLPGPLLVAPLQRGQLLLETTRLLLPSAELLAQAGRLAATRDTTATVYNQWPLKALYNTALHSPVHAHIHTPTAESTVQGDSQLVRSS